MNVVTASVCVVPVGVFKPGHEVVFEAGAEAPVAGAEDDVPEGTQDGPNVLVPVSTQLGTGVGAVAAIGILGDEGD